MEMQSNRDEYYLSQLTLFQVPELQEVLGQLRGRGAGALTDQDISVEERATLVGLQYGVERSFANILQQFALLSSNPSLEKYFSAEINRFETAAGNFRDLFVEKVIDVEYPTTTSAEFFAQATQAIDALGAVDQMASTKLLENALEAREKADNARIFLICLALVAILLGCYMAMGILIALNTSVQSVNNLTQELTRS